MDLIILYVLCFSFSTGMMIISYPVLAQQKGWPIGLQFLKPTTFIGIWGIVLTIGSLVLSLIYNVWWSLFLVLIGGWIISMILIAIFRFFSQYIAILFLIISLILINVYVF